MPKRFEMLYNKKAAQFGFLTRALTSMKQRRVSMLQYVPFPFLDSESKADSWSVDGEGYPDRRSLQDEVSFNAGAAISSIHLSPALKHNPQAARRTTRTTL